MYLFLVQMGLKEFFNQSVGIKSIIFNNKFNQNVYNLQVGLETIEFCFCRGQKLSARII